MFQFRVAELNEIHISKSVFSENMDEVQFNLFVDSGLR
jgi:hypothetical protein